MPRARRSPRAHFSNRALRAPGSRFLGRPPPREPAGEDGNSEATGAAVVIAAEDCAGGIEVQVGSVTVFVQGMKALVSRKPAAKLLAGIQVLQVLKARAHALHRCAVVKYTELQNRLSGHAPAVKPDSDVVSISVHVSFLAKSLVYR